MPFLPSAADSVALPLVTSPFSVLAVSNLAFTPESEIESSWQVPWCYQGWRGTAVVKLNFSLCATLFFPVLFFSRSPYG